MPTVANSIIPPIYGGVENNNGNDRKVEGVLNYTNVPVVTDALLNQSQTAILTETANGSDTSEIVISKVTGEVFTLKALADANGITSTGGLANKIIKQEGMWQNYRLIKKGEVVVPDPDPEPPQGE